MRTRKHLTKIAATVALVAGAAGVAGVGTFGAYTDTTTANTSVSSGKVSVLMNNDKQGVQTAVEKILLGDTVRYAITLQREDGSAELGTVGLTSTITNPNALSSALRLSVDTCPTAWTGDQLQTCSGTLKNVATNIALPNGTFAAIPGWEAMLNAGPVFARVSLTLPDTPENSATTAGMSTDIAWTVTATQRTAKTTAVTPVGLTKP